jgi:hypothetical protein
MNIIPPTLYTYSSATDCLSSNLQRLKNQRSGGQMGEAYRADGAGEMHARFWWGGLKETTSKT